MSANRSPTPPEQSVPTNCMEAFKRWWDENSVLCTSKGIKQEYAWMIYRAGWHGEPK